MDDALRARDLGASGGGLDFWLREIEHATKNQMSRVNGKARKDAQRRSESDISIHKWAQSLPAQLLSGDGGDDVGALGSESAPAPRRRKRPLTTSLDTPIESGTRSVAVGPLVHRPTLEVWSLESCFTVRILRLFSIPLQDPADE